jgi:hypothetical protein
MTKKKSKKKIEPKRSISDPVIYFVLVTACLAYWLPFFRHLDLVSFDGTSYLSQARDFFTSRTPSGAFPIGYPFFAAVFNVLLDSLVRSGQVVSLLAGIGSVLVLFVLAKRYMGRAMAFFCALFLAAMPLVLRISLTTYSEFLYIFWILSGLLLFSKKRHIWSGVALGIAAITRPEAIGIFVVLVLLRLRRPRKLARMVVAFAAIYFLNVATFYVWFDQFVILPKSNFLGTSAQSWVEREAKVTAEKRPDDAADIMQGEEIAEQVAQVEEEEQDTVPRDLSNLRKEYFERLPRETLQTAKQTGYVILLLAIFGMIIKPRLYLLASFLPFFVYPLFTVRSDARYILPYIPILILYAFIGVDFFKRRPVRYAGYALLVLAAATSIFVNRNQLTDRVDGAVFEYKEAGLLLRSRIPPRSKIADRKPHIAFYAGGEYVQIPLGPYDQVIQFLVDQDVDYLCIHKPTLKKLRPAMLGLIDRNEVIRGEVRFRPVFRLRGSLVVYERDRNATDLTWRKLVGSEHTSLAFPRWSPDGSRIAFQSQKSGQRDLYIVSVKTDSVSPLVTWPSKEGSPAWSPDGRKLAFVSDRTGNREIFVIDIKSGRVRQITKHRAYDVPTSWSPDGREIFFSSNREGPPRVYSKDLATGEIRRHGTDENLYPSVSPDGGWIACVRKRKSLVLVDMDTQTETIPEVPEKVHFPPRWSPDGQYLAVTAGDWGSDDIYLMKADGSTALVLTKDGGFDGFPDWSPDGERLVLGCRGSSKCGCFVMIARGSGSGVNRISPSN